MSAANEDSGTVRRAQAEGDEARRRARRIAALRRQRQRIDEELAALDVAGQPVTAMTLATGGDLARLLVHAAPCMACEIDFNGPRFLSVNDTACAMLGYARDAVLAMSPFALQDAQGQGALRDCLARALAGEPLPATLETTLQGNHEERLDTLIEFALTVRDGHPAGVVCFLHDITTRKHMEAQLRHTHDELRATWDALPDLVFEVDRDLRITTFHAAHPELLYAPADAFIGRQVDDVLPAEAAAIIRAAMAEAMRTGHHHGAVYPLPVSTGTGWFELNIAAKDDPQAPDAQFVAIVRDITAHKDAETALQESEERYRTLFSGTHTGIVLTDVHTRRFTFANPEFCRMLGYTEDELTHLGVEDIHPPATLAGTLDEFDALVRQEQDVAHDIACLRQDGTVFYADISAKPIVLDGQALLAGFFHDVTARKQAEDEREALLHDFQLQAAELRETLNAIADGVLLVNADGQIHWINQIASDYLGYSDEQITLPLRDRLQHATTYHLDQTPLAYEENPIVHALRGETVSGQLVLAGPEADQRWLSVSAAPIRDQEGAITGAIATLTDITAQRESEALRQQSALLDQARQTLAEAQRIAHLGSFEYHAATQTIDWSEEQYRIYGLDPTEPPPSYEAMLRQHIHPDDAAVVDDSFKTALQRGAIYELEHRIVRPDGSVRWIYNCAQPYHDEHGALIRYVGTTLDITERKLYEEALRENERRLRLALEAARMVTWEWDLTAGAIRYSTNIADIARGADIEPYEQIDSLMWHVHPDDQADLAQAIQRTTADGVHFECEYRVMMQDGAYHWILGKGDIVESLDGGPVRALGISLDITERKRAEDVLQASEEEKRLILDAVGEVIAFHDTAGQLVWANRAYCEATGRSLAELQGQSCYQSWGLAQLCVACPVKAALRSGHVCEGELSSDNQPHWPAGQGCWHVRATPVRSHDGALIGVIEVARDITAQRQAEQSLREREALYRSLVEHNPAVTYLNRIAPGHPNLFLSPRIQAILGYTEDELTRDPALWYDLIVPEDRDAVEEHSRQILHGLLSYDLEYRMRTREEQIVWLHDMGAVICDQDGKPQYTQGVLLDITAQRQAEQERETLRGELAQAQKLKTLGQLAGGIAHDFNNMLGVILAQSELALGDLAKEHPLRAHLTEIQQAATRSAHLTRQLLAFARKQAIQPRVLRLNDTVASMLTMLQRLIGANITLGWHPEADLWAVKMDPAQIDQLLANLCVNARDAIGHTGTVTIETGNRVLDAAFCAEYSDCTPGDYVQLTVRDDGCGMDAETLIHLFEPFYTTKAVGQGTGLGLSTCYGIVKQNGGAITVESTPGQGTVFTLFFPRHTGQAKADATPKPLPVTPGRETVLVVEDEPAILRAVTLILKGHGYQVLGAATPTEALGLAEAHDGAFQLLLTDLTMPEMSGLDLAERLRTRYPALRCVLMTGFSADMLTRRGMLAEDIHYVAKPFTIEQLAGKVREVLDL